MILFQEDIQDCVLLKWSTDPSLTERGCYGLKDGLVRAGILDPREMIVDLAERVQVIGVVDDLVMNRHDMAAYQALKQANVVNDLTVKFMVYELFRQGYIGAGFYIIEFNSAH